MPHDFGVLLIAAIAVLMGWAELLRRINGLRGEILTQVVTQRLQLGDFQIKPVGERLEIRHADTLLAELEREVLRMHGTFIGSKGQRAEYCGTGLRFYDKHGAARARFQVDDGELGLVLAGGERFEGELAVERDPTPPPPAYGIADQSSPGRAGIALILDDQGSSEIWIARPKGGPERIA